MVERRRVAIAEVQQDFDAGILREWKDVVGLITPFPRGDTHYEGQELEKPLEEGEAAFEEKVWEVSPSSEEGSADEVEDAAPGQTTDDCKDAALVAVTDQIVVPKTHVEQALQSYEAMLNLSRREGSCIDKSAVAYLSSKVRQARTRVRRLEKTKESAVLIDHQANAAAMKEDLAAIQQRIKDADEAVKQRKAAAKAVKDSKKDLAPCTTAAETLWVANVLDHFTPMSMAVRKQLLSDAAQHSQVMAPPVEGAGHAPTSAPGAGPFSGPRPEPPVAPSTGALPHPKRKLEGQFGLAAQAMEAAMGPSDFVMSGEALGQGKKNGGDACHVRARMEALSRLRRTSEKKGVSMPMATDDEWCLFLTRWEAARLEEFQKKGALPSIGSATQKELKALFKKVQEGNEYAVQHYVKEWVKKLPDML